ncbi:type I-E CRISPR-associated protein Cas6/Cse3/CasE [Streptomyces sp. BI20]|uniref:type I-E CRISPR-associated protein Cas6/Cse3/CasE n=1 Tax=Streptomyces sp. BI20 TaxID=3403460 RepID=UPI003C763EA7
MYLTRFPVNAARSHSRALLSSPHLMHGAVNAAFPDLGAAPPDGKGPRVLWRLDHRPTGGVDLLITSPRRPDLTHLVEQAGWPTLPEPGWTSFAYGEFLDSLASDSVWRFRLTANPVHYIRRDDTPHAPTRRAGHRTPSRQIEWLLRRQEAAGFEVLPTPAEQRMLPGGDDHMVSVERRLPLRFRRGNTERRADVRVNQVSYEGVLRATDVNRLRRTLTQGLGKGRAYGCGLMTLAAPTGIRLEGAS